MKITLPIEEKRKLWAVAKELYKSKHPTALAKYSFDGRHPTIRDYEGFLGEKAVATFLGIDYDATIYELHGDGGCDLVDGSTKIGVKTTGFQPKPYLLVKEAERKADIYFLVELYRNTGELNIAGWLDKETIVDRVPRKMHPKGPDNYVVYYEELNSVNTYRPVAQRIRASAS